MSALTDILAHFRSVALTEREKGTYFEDLIRAYLRHEATYADLYSDVWTYADWAKTQNLVAKDTGIDLVAKTRDTDEFHAIQCKFYDADYKVRKEDIDSFFTASGQKPFTHRVIVTTTLNWTDNAAQALIGQQPPVSRIDLHDLENSRIDWSRYRPSQPVELKPRKSLRPHQTKAVADVLSGLTKADRGKLIMACGTGKTFTALKIAENIAGQGGRVLFLVPSLSLLSQTLTEWTQESSIPLHSFAVCSDAEVGKKRKKSDDDTVQTFAHELRYPATTHAGHLAHEMGKRHDAKHLSVVFSTYHSIEVISAAQKQHGLPDFDLIVCDEAHRTTGATFDNEDESTFVKVHDAAFIRAAKRLYMTATPRIYADTAKAVAEKENATLCSMDDPALYGDQLHVITFSEAVTLGLLCDYKVLVLTVDAKHISHRLQSLLADGNNTLKVDDAARIVGCWKALAKQGQSGRLDGEDAAMRRAVAFCQVIERTKDGKTHKVSSKEIAGMFSAVVEAYRASEDPDGETPSGSLACEAAHVDGGMNAAEKEAKLAWLKADAPADTCRILSNVRCLSEGVDVPALDAVLFLTPRNSQVDVVQSVGRVMRNAPGKKRGYVIIPVVIPENTDPTDALDKSDTYRVVWEVLQALRSHDDRFDAFVNKLDLIGRDTRKMEVIAVTDELKKKSAALTSGKTKKTGRNTFGIGEVVEEEPGTYAKQTEIVFNVGEIERALYVKVVKKCGNRLHWEDWAKDIAKIAQTHLTRIQAILDNPANTRERAAFEAFAAELRDDLNPEIKDEAVIEMLAQHLITKPVFDALFKDYSFAANNPVSLAMQAMLDLLQEHRLDKEADTLEKFYASVRMRAEGIDSIAGKQTLIKKLYDSFFANAFTKTRDALGIVYTPVEVVDFIIHSVNDLLKQEFGKTLADDGVHILDPFTGTGTFITRLLQSGLIPPDRLAAKYGSEIHANEIVLLAYYIAAINIEAVYHALARETNPAAGYTPFTGICLTDTFRLGEEDLVSALLAGNSDRRKRQQKLDVRVIIGNPPYSAGQESANDNNQNVAYPALDKRIEDTYAARSSANLSKGLYDSYIRSIRWASDRIGKSGIIGFVSGSAWVERSFADGMRKSLAEEFTNIHVFHLRGDVRKNMLSKGAAKEGGNVFDSGSMTGIAITFWVKNPEAKSHGNIFFHNIGDDLKSEEKRARIAEIKSIAGISAANGWQSITPDKHGDWLNQRDDSFATHLAMGDKKGTGPKLFENFSLGISTNRDTWCYNASKAGVAANMSRMIAFYNEEVDGFQKRYAELDKKTRESLVHDFVNNDPSRISWTVNLKDDLVRGHRFEFEPAGLSHSLYRPYTKQWFYYNRDMNERVLQMPRIFPNAAAENRVICVSGVGARAGFSALMSDTLTNLHTLDSSQNFPLYLYDTEPGEPESESGDLFAKSSGMTSRTPKRRSAITDAGLAHFRQSYPESGDAITKEDIFYYTYGILHSPDYREKFADNLSKELPRIPAVKSYADFQKFTQAGRALAELHIGYETVPPHAGIKVDLAKSVSVLQPEHYRVIKMKFAKTRTSEGKSVDDKSTVIYNDCITLRNIPLAAYDYIVNGKPALEWVMERQCVKPDKDSGIVNDANLYATETIGDPRYPLDLFLRIITVSLETSKLVTSLPKLDI